MARVTVEDCLKNVENRFDLVIKAARRAHMLELGEADTQVPVDNDKPTVLALREIAEGFDITKTRKSLAQEEAADSETGSERAYETSSLLLTEMPTDSGPSSEE